jgi:hypothetical protein
MLLYSAWALFESKTCQNILLKFPQIIKFDVRFLRRWLWRVSFLGCNTLHFVEGLTFRREILIPFSSSKSKLSKILLVSRLVCSSAFALEVGRSFETLCIWELHWLRLRSPHLSITWRLCPCKKPWRPTGLWDVEASAFSRQSDHRWRWGCQSYAPRPLFTPRKIPGTHFCQRLIRPQGHSAVGTIRSIEKSSDLIGNRSRDPPGCRISYKNRFISIERSKYINSLFHAACSKCFCYGQYIPSSYASVCPELELHSLSSPQFVDPWNLWRPKIRHQNSLFSKPTALN